MKQRHGFVSNSSSSSFLLGIAIIEDGDKFDKWWKEINSKSYSSYGVSITTVHDISKGNDNYFGDGETKVKDGVVEVDCFRGDTVSLSIDGRSPADRVLIVNISNNEGDCSWPTDSYGSPDHDIDLDFLGSDQVKIHDGILAGKENGLADGQVTFGAARNG